jgi:2-keto-4-pentenoate hydratase
MTIDIGVIARKLVADHQAAKRFEPFAASSGICSLRDAYSVQGEYVRLQGTLSSFGTAGYKVGLTSRQMQAMCGIDSPVSGVIMSDRVLNNPAELDGSRFGRLGLEFEIAVRMGKDLPPDGRELTLSDVAVAVDGVCAAIELVDDRGCDYSTLDVLSLVADNSWNAGIVHGAFCSGWPELAESEGIVLANGIEIGRGFGGDALGHPFIPLAWLANHLVDLNSFLRAGDIVMTGSLIKTQFPSVSTRYQFSVEGLGQVTCQVTF